MEKHATEFLFDLSRARCSEINLCQTENSIESVFPGLFYSILCRNESNSEPHCLIADVLSEILVNNLFIHLLTFTERLVSHDWKLPQGFH